MFNAHSHASRAFAIIGALLPLLACISCGYHFSGTQSAPFGIYRVSVLMFENMTSEMGVESVLANDFIAEITRDGRLTLAEPHRADAIFTGIVKTMTVETISRVRGYAAAERSVGIGVDVLLTDKNEKILWSAKDVQANESYLVTDDKLATEYNRKTAIALISRKIVEDIYQRLNRNF